MHYFRVLVADRNATFLEKTAEILSSAGYHMIAVNNGGRALTVCRHEQPDVALLNVDLAQISGIETCQRIKTQIDPALPVTLMFADEMEGMEEIAAQCGADNFLIRPLKRTELLFSIRALLQLRKLSLEKGASLDLFSRREQLPTGMVSLDAFYIFLRLEIQRVDRYGFPVSLLYIGVDPLPEDGGAWSNTLNHQLGPALAQTMRSCLRDIDLSAILSPREMLVLMPHTDSTGARIVADRIRQTVSNQSYNFGRVHIQPTVSIGGACLHGERMAPEDFLAHVKAFRDRAANAGGNRIYFR